MPNSPSMTALQAFVAPAAIGIDHDMDVTLEAHALCALPYITEVCSPGVVAVASVLPWIDPTDLVTRVHTQCGVDIAIEVANRRRAGSRPIRSSELRKILDRLASDGFDGSDGCDIQEIWRSGTELEAALMLLRWTAVMYTEPEAATDGPALSRVVARQANRLFALAEATMDAAHIRQAIDRLTPAMLSQRFMSPAQLNALTADLPRQGRFAKLDWPWLTQRIAARGALDRRPGDDQHSHTSP